ncbi:hypothetical protein [Desulfonatronum parangueonense]
MSRQRQAQQQYGNGVSGIAQNGMEYRQKTVPNVHQENVAEDQHGTEGGEKGECSSLKEKFPAAIEP